MGVGKRTPLSEWTSWSLVPAASRAVRTSAMVVIVPPRPASGGWTLAPLSQALDDHRHALPTAHAHRLQAVGRVERLEVVEERAQDAGAGHPERMAEGDGATVRVQLVAEWVHAQAVGAGDHLGRERLVELDHVDVVDGHPGAPQRLLARLDRAQAHDLGLQSRHAGRDDPGQRPDAEL